MPSVPATPQSPPVQQAPARSTQEITTPDSNENVWSNVSGFSRSLLGRKEEAEIEAARSMSDAIDVALKIFFGKTSEKTDVTPNSTNNAELAPPSLVNQVAREHSPAPPGGFPVPMNLLRDHLTSVGKPRVSKAPSVAESTMSGEALLNRPSLDKSEVSSIVSSGLSLADLINGLPSLVPTKAQGTPEPEEKPVETRTSFSAAFVEDVTAPDGQVFPPGAEFVKCWRLMNDGGHDWPESTELVFVAGETLSAQSLTVELGKVSAGAEIDVWTGELKAPDAPGRYVGYWRLRANGEVFGNSLWIE
jgi:next-to-BRCA1 protein 1